MAGYKKFGRRPGRRRRIKFNIEDIDYKNVTLLQNFLNDKGKIKPARSTGVTPKQQRKIAQAIKRARNIALLPYTVTE